VIDCLNSGRIHGILLRRTSGCSRKTQEPDEYREMDGDECESVPTIYQKCVTSSVVVRLCVFVLMSVRWSASADLCEKSRMNSTEICT
jgi:hypothetical protein